MLAEELEGLDISKVEDKIGIKNRHVANKDETVLELAFEAAKAVLNDFDKNMIDFIIFCTQTPTYILPTTACILQNKLELGTSVGALDFNLGCSGYVYGLSLSKGLISSGVAKNILLITADTYTKYIHPKDKGNRSIFGDAATATIISENHRNNLGEFVFGTDGSGFESLIIRNGGAKSRFDEKAINRTYGDQNVYNDNFIYMNGPDIFNFTISKIPSLIEETLKKNKLILDQVDYFIFHQANSFMLEYLRKKIGIPKEKFHNDMTDTGNTVSSTIPIALSNAKKQGFVKNGDKVFLAGFGVGLSWGATVIEV